MTKWSSKAPKGKVRWVDRNRPFKSTCPKCNQAVRRDYSSSDRGRRSRYECGRRGMH